MAHLGFLLAFLTMAMCGGEPCGGRWGSYHFNSCRAFSAALGGSQGAWVESREALLVALPCIGNQKRAESQS